MKEIKRGEIYAADFGAGFGSEQGGVRPVLILQNNTGNKTLAAVDRAIVVSLGIKYLEGLLNG